MGIVLLLLVLALTFAIFRRLLREEGSSGPSAWPPVSLPELTRRDFLGARTPKVPPSNDPNEVARRSGSWG